MSTCAIVQRLGDEQLFTNKVSPWQNVTLLAHCVLPPGELRCAVECYRRRRQTTEDDDRRQQTHSVQNITMCRQASNEAYFTLLKCTTWIKESSPQWHYRHRLCTIIWCNMNSFDIGLRQLTGSHSQRYVSMRKELKLTSSTVAHGLQDTRCVSWNSCSYCTTVWKNHNFIRLAIVEWPRNLKIIEGDQKWSNLIGYVETDHRSIPISDL